MNDDKDEQKEAEIQHALSTNRSLHVKMSEDDSLGF